jgi:transposase
MTPILRHPARRGKNLSMSAICCYRPDGSEARLAFGLREGAYDAPSLVRQLGLLSSVLGGEPAIVIWDNLNVHKSHDMRAFVAAQAWLEVAWLPPYAPELNPAEGLWANLKSQELANHACRSTKELAATAQVGSFRVRRDQQLLLGFLHQTPSPL